MNKVLIRPLRFEDASVSWKWRNDPEVWKHTGSRPNIVITEEIEKQWVLGKLEEHNSARFAIEVDDVYVGNIQLTNIVEKETAEYHVFIGDKSYWGKGVASLATAQIIRYAKNLLNLQSLYLHVRPENISAIKVYEKSGFVKINDDVKMTLDLLKAKIPLVSVFMMAYNHEKYISEAIDGVLMQKTNFDFDIVIGEDCSKDNTRQIILDYQKKYPGKFKLLLHENNIGAIANQLDVFSSCTGKYIAMCEGDDYWTDPYKLQKQVDFLEVNEDFAFCFHKVKVNRDDKIEDDFMQEVNEITTIYDLAKGLYVRTLSVIFRSSILKSFSENQKNNISGDYSLFLLLSEHGKIKYFNETMGVYRIHDGGVWSKVNETTRKSDSIDKLFKLYKYFEHDKMIQSIIGENIKRNLFYFFDICIQSSSELQFNNLVKRLITIEADLISSSLFQYSSNLKANMNDIKKSRRYQLGDLLLRPVQYFKSKI